MRRSLGFASYNAGRFPIVGRSSECREARRNMHPAGCKVGAAYVASRVAMWKGKGRFCQRDLWAGISDVLKFILLADPSHRIQLRHISPSRDRPPARVAPARLNSKLTSEPAPARKWVQAVDVSPNSAVSEFHPRHLHADRSSAAFLLATSGRVSHGEAGCRRRGVCAGLDLGTAAAFRAAPPGQVQVHLPCRGACACSRRGDPRGHVPAQGRRHLRRPQDHAGRQDRRAP